MRTSRNRRRFSQAYQIHPWFGGSHPFQPAIHLSGVSRLEPDSSEKDKTLTCPSGGHRRSIYRLNMHSSCLHGISWRWNAWCIPKSAWLTPFFIPIMWIKAILFWDGSSSYLSVCHCFTCLFPSSPLLFSLHGVLEFCFSISQSVEESAILCDYGSQYLLAICLHHIDIALAASSAHWRGIIYFAS